MTFTATQKMGSTPQSGESTSVDVTRIAGCLDDTDCIPGAVCVVATNACVLPPPVVTAPAKAAEITERRPTLTGTAAVGATVDVYVDGVLVGQTVATDGTWSLPVTSDLDFGEHAIRAVSTLGTLTSESDQPHKFYVMLPEPVVMFPTDGSSTTDRKPSISGSALPGTSVTVCVDGVPYGPVVTASTGEWTIPLTADLVFGEHAVYALASTTQGTGNGTTATSELVVFDVVPTAPVITSFAVDSTTLERRPVIEGTAQPGTWVTINVDGANTYGPVLVAPNGTWSIPVTDDLAFGSHGVVATASDDDAAPTVTSAYSGLVEFTIVPAAPAITGPTAGSTLNDPTPTVSGTGEPGATVTIYVDGDPIGTTIVGEDGTWTFTPDVELPGIDGTFVTITIGEKTYGPVQVENGKWSIPVTDDLAFGEHTVVAIATSEGVTSGPSGDFDFAVAPPAPVITGPYDDSVSNTATPVITGRGEPGAEVTVFIDDVAVGTTVVDENGDWRFVPDIELDEGEHEFTAEQTLNDVTSELSPAVHVTIIAGCLSDADCVVGTSCDVEANACVLAPPVITSPKDGETLDARGPVITGTGVPGAVVTVYVDGESVGTTVVDEAGEWSLEVPGTLQPGEHVVTATQTFAGLASNPTEELLITAHLPCDSDAMCGGADSGLVCDVASGECVNGCYLDEDRNHCPSELVCDAQAEGERGECVTPEEDVQRRFGVMGGGFGFGCAAGGDTGVGGLLAVLALLGLMTRRRTARDWGRLAR